MRRYLKWRKMRTSKNVLYQSTVHKVRPKQSKERAFKEALADFDTAVKDGNSIDIYKRRNRVRLGD